MTCTPACLCNCGQTGCGCHVGTQSTAEPAVPMTGKSAATRIDPLCSLPAYVQVVKSPAGKAVEVQWCPRCDVRGAGR